MSFSDRDLVIYGAIGFSVWLSGAVEFHFGGGYLFQSGNDLTILSAIFIAVAVCLIFRTTILWRGTARREAVSVAVAMGLPGLFGEVLRQLFFTHLTRLLPETQRLSRQP